MKNLLVFLCSVVLTVAIATHCAHARTFNTYSPANGIQKNTGTTPNNTAAVSSDIAGLWTDASCTTGTALLTNSLCALVPVIATGTANQVPVYTGSNALGPAASWTYDGTNQVFGSASSGVVNTSFVCSGDTALSVADSHCLAYWTDSQLTGNSGIAFSHYALAPDSISSFNSNCAETPACDIFNVMRSNISGACQQGVAIAFYLPCRILMTTGGGLSGVFGPLNNPTSGGSKDLGWRFRCGGNDSCGHLFGNHALGNEAYEWHFIYSYSNGSSNQRIGDMTEIVPAAASSASSAQRVPLCGLTIPYNCTVYAPNLTLKLSDGNASSNITGLTNGVTFANYTKTVGTANVVAVVGDALNTNSSYTMQANGVSLKVSNGLITETGVTTGTAANFMCLDSSGNFILQSTPCLGAPLVGTTGAIGGSLLAPGACSAGTASVTGATSSMAVAASPSSDPDSTLSTGIAIYSFVSAANTVTVRVCAIVSVTPAAVTYNVRVIQ